MNDTSKNERSVRGADDTEIDDFLIELRARFDELDRQLGEVATTPTRPPERRGGAVSSGGDTAEPSPAALVAPPEPSAPAEPELPPPVTEPPATVPDSPAASVRASNARQVQPPPPRHRPTPQPPRNAPRSLADALAEADAQVRSAAEPRRPIGSASAAFRRRGSETEPPPSQLPRPTAARRRGTRRRVAIGAAALIVVSAGAIGANRLLAGPEATPDEPEATPDEPATAQVSEPIPPSPSELRVAVESALRDVQLGQVKVQVEGTVVVLSGTVTTDTARARASEVTSTVDGVVQIDNRLVVEVVHEPAALQDAATVALQAAGFANLDVTVVDSAATISGVVPYEDLGDGYFAYTDRAVAAVLGVDGIDAVTSRLLLRGNVDELTAEVQALIGQAPVRFALGSTELDESHRATLDQLAALVMAYPGLGLDIAGHSDGGIDPVNLQLATDRASAVRAHLVGQGLDRNSLAVVPYSELFPGTFGDSGRIEFVVTR